MRPGDTPIEVRETWGTCQPKTTDRIVRVGRIDSVTDSSVTVDRRVCPGTKHLAKLAEVLGLDVRDLLPRRT